MMRYLLSLLVFCCLMGVAQAQDLPPNFVNVTDPQYAGGAPCAVPTIVGGQVVSWTGGDGTPAVLAAINDLFSRPSPGGTLFVPCHVIVYNALAIPYTNAAAPQQPPLRITGIGTRWDGGLTGFLLTGGSALDTRYDGADGQHNARIVTIGRGILEFDHVEIGDMGGASYLPEILTIGTVIRSNGVHWIGRAGCDPANANSPCTDIIDYGGQGMSSANLCGTVETNGFCAYGSTSVNDFFSYCRRAVTFGGSANGIMIENPTLDFTCGSTEWFSAPFVFTGAGLQTVGNEIHGGIVEAPKYKYAAAFLTNSYQNKIDGLGFYDESQYTVAYAFFLGAPSGVNGGPGTTRNLIIPGYIGGEPIAAYGTPPTTTNACPFANVCIMH